jgi:hypothetical protein
VPTLRDSPDLEFDYWLGSLAETEHRRALRLMAFLPRSMMTRCAASSSAGHPCPSKGKASGQCPGSVVDPPGAKAASG